MPRVDVLGVLRGERTFVDDFPFSGKYGVFVRSPYPHARIVGIDVSRAVSNGALVLTGRDLAMRLGGSVEREGASLETLPMAVDKVRYQGEPVALVIADDPYRAADLAELVDVQYEPLKPVRNVDDALRNESLVFEELGTNVVQQQTIEFGTMPTGDRVLELELYWSRSSGNPIETFAAIVKPEGDGVTIISNLQGGSSTVKEVERSLGVPVNHVFVRHGGSFGSKFSLVRHLVVLAYAALRFKVPIKWVETRTEHLMASNSSGPERRFRVRAYYRGDGTVTGLDMTIYEDAGATKSSGQAFKPLGILAGPYKIRNIRYTAYVLATNKNPAGAFRGAGTPPHTWALERIMDAVADELGMDRAEVRMRNLIDSFPYEAPYAYYDSGNPRGLLQMALSRTDILSMRDEVTGVGIAVSTDPSTPQGGEGVRIRIRNGKVIVGLGFGGEGQGNEHTAVELVSKLLEVPMENVTYEYLPSNEAPQAFGPGGSRMAVFTAGAVIGAVEELRSRLANKAARVLGGNVRYEKGYFYSGNSRVSIFEIGEGEESTYVYTAEARKGRFTAYPFAADIAVVRLEEGKIRPIKHVVYIDPGTPIDEELVKEQVMGGTATGIGLALYEAYRYDEDGNLLTLSLGDYGMPNAMDIPEIEVHIVPTPSPATPMGAKGIGEIPVGVAAAAVTAAVEDLLRRRGRRVFISSVPIDPELFVGIE
ncbi:xanthine dehydrogenase family protein molybdopterin-binding subunit [Vulcanisaeta thermophila]|uniref:xanthine dehydrogenase family protein molybdopterin-binding subunit n=1 Tax=Vulcanisaeta thermophila TaxID=867917 RepID=UPI000852BF9D|nr:xanthine dehydrogenase family protein molybdopterin-binding subunit [Vulcanisaeta thermophila]